MRSCHNAEKKLLQHLVTCRIKWSHFCARLQIAIFLQIAAITADVVKIIAIMIEVLLTFFPKMFWILLSVLIPKNYDMEFGISHLFVGLFVAVVIAIGIFTFSMYSVHKNSISDIFLCC